MGLEVQNTESGVERDMSMRGTLFLFIIQVTDSSLRGVVKGVT